MTATAHRLRYGLCAMAITIIFIGQIALGSVAIPLNEVFGALLGGEVRESWRNIIMEFRLPRALNAVVSGAALGVAGLLLQTLFRNPLADPYVLGLVHGARLGAAMLVVAAGVAGNALLLRFGLLGDVGLAVASVAGSTIILLALSFVAPRVTTVTLLIVGLMLGYLAIGTISVLLHFIDETQATAFNIWNDASFAGATPQQLAILVPTVTIGIGAAFMMAKSLNSLLLGERYATTLGVNVAWTKRICLFIVAWLSGVVTAFCGPVAFLGLVAAQLARGLFLSSDHRVIVPGAALIGAVLALAADWVTHLPWSQHVLHLNAVIGLVGAPVALWVLLGSRAMRSFDS